MLEFRRAILALNICAGLVCLSSAEAQVSQAEQRRRLPRDHELTIQWALARSGAVVRAEVISTDPMAYDAQNDEAFTHVILNIVDVVAGSEELLGEMELFLRGGVLPNGSVRYIADLPMLVEGETCVLFLKDGDYNITPFAIWHVFREVTLEGEDILVDEHGRVVEFHEDGRITFAERTTVARTNDLWWSRIGDDSGPSVTRSGLPSNGLPHSRLRANRQRALLQIANRGQALEHTQPFRSLPRPLPQELR